jgi:hypothetical protein
LTQALATARELDLRKIEAEATELRAGT